MFWCEKVRDGVMFGHVKERNVSLNERQIYI